jgi:transcriptional regulator with XRE-family HTH domain
MKIDHLTPDAAILKELGHRLARVRKQQGLSQQQLADEVGLGVATLRRIEAGQDAQIGSWLKIMKTMGMVASIDALLPENFASPMAEVLSTSKRLRGVNAQIVPGRWGDEKP